MITRTATARYEGFGKEGTGQVSTQSGVLDNQAYGFGTRFGEERGTNPEELVAAAHASCFTMALSFALARAGFTDGDLQTSAKITLEQEEGGYRISRSDLTLEARVPGIEADQFDAIANEAKANCPISKLLNAEISLNHVLAPE